MEGLGGSLKDRGSLCLVTAREILHVFACLLQLHLRVPQFRDPVWSIRQGSGPVLDREG